MASEKNDTLEEASLFGEEIEEIGQEEDSDLEGISEVDFAETSLAPTDWTVETILSQLKDTALDLNPDFQRRDAWTIPRKSKFIESLMLGLPVPQLVLAEENSDEGTYIVIDGKQRLLTLERFFDPEDGFKLTGLTALAQLNGQTCSDLTEDPAQRKYIRRLKNRTIRTVVIRKWPNKSFLHLVFHRLNHQTLPLSPQELRQALSPGEFTTFADRYAANSRQINSLLGIKNAADFRMRDVELLVRFTAFKFFLPEYTGNLKKFLDETCDRLNDTWPSRQEEIESAAGSCDEAIDVTREVFGSDAFHRYSAGGYETRFNRTVFDIMAFYFSQPSIAAEALTRRVAVKSEFERLSVEDLNFAEALKSTTKTIDATSRRFTTWGESLAKVLGLEFPVPHLEGRRISYP
ncbi:DUF262 domain-containing protein [Streptomyces sp. WAC 05379]|uniref:DUF262 domain-containing protein n=1 Tax=Streptomyces TaxID=1883 RepID=UPI000F74AF7D|nr:DUF262 domain-containing protein [Streptomyces sp. WAC 05379]RSN91155.1 DUF262 domain-containing protein [Streptomyces sp. WAC 05379]